MKIRRFKVNGGSGYYHCMSRTVNGEHLFKGREKEMLRQMIWQVADFSGVEVLTYCVMGNHFHVLVRIPELARVSDVEIMRRYRVLYPEPTKYQAASARLMEAELKSNGPDAEAIRCRLLARMGDVSEFMKTLKQRFSVWYNKSHERFGTLWAERFKSVLVEGAGNALQTMAAYIDLNPVRKGLVDDPKDYRFCGYAEAVAGKERAQSGLLAVWRDWQGTSATGLAGEALRSHRMLLFGKGASPWTHRGKLIDPKQAAKVLEKEGGVLPKSAVLRCRVRYFTDGAIFGSIEFVRDFTAAWQAGHSRKYPPRPQPMKGADWGDLAVIRGLRRRLFS